MFVWGRNNSHLIRQNHKKTYSLPQPLQFTATKCAAGYDYLLLKQNQTFSCYYQAAIMKLPLLNLIDFATSDNMIVVVTTEGKALISEFNPQAISEGFNFSPIRLQEQNVKEVYMNYGQIFLVTESDRVYFMKRNQWYDTKNYSDPEEIQELTGKDIIKIAPAFHINYFLSSKGQLYSSSKADPTHASPAKSRLKYIDISAADYFVGIAENGRLYIWGKYMQENYDEPIQFGKISQKFCKVYLNSDNGFAITQSGEGWVWGKNANGELGISDYEPRSKPFPLITLKNYKISSFVQGEGFTICFAEEVKAKKRAENLLILQSSHNQIHSQISNKRKNNFSISSIPSIQIREFNKQKSKSPIKNSVKPQLPRQNYFKTVQIEKNTPPKQSNLSKSPLDKSASKSPVSKYKGPYIQHMRQKSQSNCRQRREISRPAVSPSKQQRPHAELNQLQQQNIKLKNMLRIKQQVINDITIKIKILEDAIEEHEKSLTNRDHLMEEYQKREKEYLRHIDDLEKELQSFIAKGSLQTSSKALNVNSKISLSEPLQQKDYYLSRIQEYEKILNHQRNTYQQKIRELEEAIQTYRSNQNQVYTLQESPLCERNSKDNMVASKVNYRSRMVQDNKAKMELIISRIQDSKVRIGKSATKLNQFLVNE